MYAHLEMATYVLYVLIGLNVAFAFMLYVLKLRHVWRARMHERFQQKLSDYFTYINANLECDEELRTPPLRMSKVEARVMQERLNNMIEAFAGTARVKLIDLCDRLGFIETHMRRLQGRIYQRKIDAAYHLGCMRAEEAVPAMLKLLRHHKWDSSLFVIARAIAKSARDVVHLKEMVWILLRHNIHVSHLIVDILEESRMDLSLLYTEWIEAEDPSLVLIGLTGQSSKPNPEIADKVYALLESDHAEIRNQAVDIYLQSSVMMPQTLLQELLHHSSADIRLSAYRRLCEWKNKVHLPTIMAGLDDADLRVVHVCATGLVRFGEEGISRLCEAARNHHDANRGVYLWQLMEEELQLLATRLHHVHELIIYNTLKYYMDKEAANDKQLIRAV